MKCSLTVFLPPPAASVTPPGFLKGKKRIEDGNCLYLRLGHRKKSETRMTVCGSTDLAFADG